MMCAGASAMAQDVASGPATQPSSTPASLPVTKTGVLATVGTAKITSQMVQNILNTIKKQDPEAEDPTPQMREQILDKLIAQRLAVAYAMSQKVDASDAEIKDQKDQIAKQATTLKMTANEFMDSYGITDDMIVAQIRIKKIFDAAMTADKADAFVKANPAYFNGTTVKAIHILIKAGPSASTADQKAALEKINKIAADIKSGKIKFEDAAKQFSEDPSAKVNGGDLGEFVFTAMVPQFSEAAFAAKVGDVTDVIRSQFGFHIIKVTGRTEGKEAPDENATKFAKAALASKIESAIYAMAMKDCPIEVNK